MLNMNTILTRKGISIMSNTKTEQECGTKGLPLGITSHPEYRYWMRHWIVVDEEMIYGYAPDNECLAFGTDIDIFFLRL